MRYARPVSIDGTIKLLEVIDIPQPLPTWAVDVEAFLVKMYDSKAQEWKNDGTWFVHVADDNVVGAVKQMDGSYLNPSAQIFPPPQVILDGDTQRRAMIRARAADLDKKKRYSEASALRATIGE